VKESSKAYLRSKGWTSVGSGRWREPNGIGLDAIYTATDAIREQQHRDGDHLSPLTVPTSPKPPQPLKPAAVMAHGIIEDNPLISAPPRPKRQLEKIKGMKGTP
jgi:hypothetical protein